MYPVTPVIWSWFVKDHKYAGEAIAYQNVITSDIVPVV
jgi:hypothetical protein